jgi:hypothetical protein
VCEHARSILFLVRLNLYDNVNAMGDSLSFIMTCFRTQIFLKKKYITPMRRVLETSRCLIIAGVMSTPIRHQSVVKGPGRMTATRSRHHSSHPLASRNPAARNITLPETFHAVRGSKEATSPEVLRKRAQDALARSMEQKVLWEGAVVDDASHQLLQHFSLLRTNRKYRKARNLFVVGGKEMIHELIRRDIRPKTLLVATDRDLPPWSGTSSQIVRVDRTALEETVPGTDGYIGDFEIPDLPQKEELIANKQRFQRVLVLDNVADAGHLGTLMRTAAAFSYDCVLLVNHCADPYDHDVVRAARGAHFQKLVPFFTLRDEDGDDVYGFINHAVQRNNLEPLCFSPASLHKGEEVSGSTEKLQRSVQRLSSFCQDQFSVPSSRGHIIFVGPDVTRTLHQRVTEKVIRSPTTLLLDDPSPSDFLLGVSSILYALRPRGEWDLLPNSMRSESSANGIGQQQRFSQSEIGPDRLILDESTLNLDEDEQISLATAKLEAKRQRRIGRKGMLDDHEIWVNAEKVRIKALHAAERRRFLEPWITASVDDDAQRIRPDWAPDIINDYRDPTDRDVLRDARQTAEEYLRPPNYD